MWPLALAAGKSQGLVAKPGETWSSRARNPPRAARAGPESGARRSLSPLPRTGMSGDLAVAIDLLRLKASDTRRPDPWAWAGGAIGADLRPPVSDCRAASLRHKGTCETDGSPTGGEPGTRRSDSARCEPPRIHARKLRRPLMNLSFWLSNSFRSRRDRADKHQSYSRSRPAQRRAPRGS